MQVGKGNQGQKNQTQGQTSMGQALHQAGIGRESIPPTQNQQPQGEPMGYAQQQQTRSWSNMAGFQRLGMSRNISSEQMTKIVQTFRELAKDNISADVTVRVTPMDMEAHAAHLAANMILVTLTPNSGPQARLTAYHTFVVGSSAGNLPPFSETFEGVNYEQPRQPSDAFSKAAADLMQQEVAQQNPSNRLLYTSLTVIQPFIDLDSKERLGSLLSNAVIAMGAALDMASPGWTDNHLKDYTGPNSAEHLESSVSFGNKTRDDFAGNAIRSDMVIQISSVPNNTNQRANNELLVARNQLTTIAGYIDLIYDEGVASMSNMFMMNGMQTQQQKPLWKPEVVITSLVNEAAQSPANQLLSLLGVLDALNAGMWVNNLHPTQVTDRPADMNDIGALGYQLNMERDPSGFGAALATKTDAFLSQNHFAMLARACIDQNPIISIDVMEGGGEFWFNNMFHSSAMGVDAATQTIIRHADELLDNRFSAHFKALNSGNYGPIFATQPRRIHAGYWTDAAGRRRDIRDADYLAIANHFGKTNPQQIIEYNRTFSLTNVSLMRRLFERMGLIKQVLGGSVVQTGWIARCTFTGNFLRALQAAAVECGYKVTPNYGRDSGGYQAAVTQAFLATAQVDPAQFQNMYMAYQPQGGNGWAGTSWFANQAAQFSQYQQPGTGY